MSNSYCPLPFRHAFVDSTGVSACCMTPRYNVPLQDWPDHPELKKLQNQLLAGHYPKTCKACHDQEASMGQSLRLNSLNDYDDQLFRTTEIDFVDYRASNVCNFKCRSCEPNYSHGIAQEARKHRGLNRFYPVLTAKTVWVTDQNQQWIVNNMSQLKRLMFTGGEPTMMPGVREIITEAVTNYPDIAVLITSNGSFTDPFWQEITQRSANIHWTLSLDSVGSAAEIVRHGTDWAVVEHNARWLAQHSPSLDINTVVTRLNLFQLGPLLKFVRELQTLSIAPSGLHGDQGCRHQFHVASRPYMLGADNWPPELVDSAKQYLEQCLTQDLDTDQENMLEGVLEQINNLEFDPVAWQRGLEFNQQLDSVRGEDHTRLYTQI